MTKFTKELINNYAEDLLIGLTEEENKIVLNEFEIIESNMNLINSIEGLSDIKPMNFPFKVYPVLRDDKKINNEDIKDLLKNSGKISDREIEVPRVVG